MKSFRIFALALIGYLVFSSSVYAANDPNAAVIQLRDPNNGGCLESGVTINNCFTDMASVNSWINTRLPNATTPLLVDIGPGTFADNFKCVNKGYITLRGAGRQNTTIGPGTDVGAGMLLKNCTNLNVSSLRVIGTYGAIQWSGTGITKWTDVEVVGQGYGWYETFNSLFPCSSQQTKHYWFSSRIEAQTFFGNVSAYPTACGENWFFGSELISSATSGWNIVFPIWVSAPGEAHIYGSVLRAIVTGAGQNTPASSVAAAYAQGGQIHIHGTGIDVISQIAAPIVALKADTGGMIHANGAAYNLSTGTGGTVTRIANNGGHVHAPYVWEHIPDPVTTPNYTSVTGTDMTTILASDGHPHLVIYDTSCTSSRWYDTVDKACRP